MDTICVMIDTQCTSTAARSLSNTTHLATPQNIVLPIVWHQGHSTNTHCTSAAAIPYKWSTSQYTPLQSSRFAFNKVDVTAHVLHHTVQVMQPTHCHSPQISHVYSIQCWSPYSLCDNTRMSWYKRCVSTNCTAAYMSLSQRLHFTICRCPKNQVVAIYRLAWTSQWWVLFRTVATTVMAY